MTQGVGSTEPKTQTKRRLTAEERRQDVLLAACRVFGERSYRGSTTAEIARASGISEPILYRHFGSKRDLYLACLDESWRRLREAAETAIAADPHSCLGAIADAYMKSQERIRLVDLWIQALSVAPEDEVIAAALRDQIRDVHDYFADVIRRGQKLGDVLADRDPVAEAWIFVASGLLATVDQRLGGLLGDDLQRVRTERRRWMLGD
ncbi:MAG TPA: TetR/AcrR family transcriptional regulator [Gaiellaceae bacterium]|nr:TetR/AcrR family transcriptional regulator [Gaiellaceae bacterium]